MSFSDDYPNPNPEIHRREDYETQGEGFGPLRSYNPRPWTGRKQAGVDLQSYPPLYTPFQYIGAHWHRWNTRKHDDYPETVDEREIKQGDFWAESFFSKWYSHPFVDMSLDNEWIIEREPGGYWGDLDDPWYKEMLREAKIFELEDLAWDWENKLQNAAVQVPLYLYLGRKLFRRAWRWEYRRRVAPYGRKHPDFARRAWYSLNAKRRRRFGKRRRRRISFIFWKRVLFSFMILLPVPGLIDSFRREWTPIGWAIAFGYLGSVFGAKSFLSPLIMGTIGWYVGAGHEFIQRYEATFIKYLHDTEPKKNALVEQKLDNLREKMPAEVVSKLDMDALAYWDDLKWTMISDPFDDWREGRFVDPVLSPEDTDLYEDYQWFRPALWRPYMWYVRPYEPVVPDPRSKLNPEDRHAFRSLANEVALRQTVPPDSYNALKIIANSFTPRPTGEKLVLTEEEEEEEIREKFGIPREPSREDIEMERQRELMRRQAAAEEEEEY